MPATVGRSASATAGLRARSDRTEGRPRATNGRAGRTEAWKALNDQLLWWHGCCHRRRPDGPAAHRRGGAGRHHPAGRPGHHRADRLRGRGVPCPPCVRRRRPQPARPVHPPGPDGRGGVRPGRAQGHPVAPAPRLRDRDVHARRVLRAPRQPRRWRHHQQRRHPVDDRRRRPAAHREAAGVAGGLRRPVPRPAAVGQPAARAEARHAALPGPARRRRHPRDHAGLRRPRPRHRRRRGRARRPGLDVHPDGHGARHARADGATAAAVAARLQRPGLRARRRGHRG